MDLSLASVSRMKGLEKSGLARMGVVTRALRNELNDCWHSSVQLKSFPLVVKACKGLAISAKPDTNFL